MRDDLLDRARSQTPAVLNYRVMADSDSISNTPPTFTWYVADVVYDIDRGRYDLRVAREGETIPFVDIRDQVNAVGIAGSKLRKFSFIGDPPGVDTSNAHFFVDDIVVRIRARDGGSVLDVRSKSRVGKGDVGANAARIRALRDAVS